MVGYDTKYKRDDTDDGYTLTVHMHWYDDEFPPEDRIAALRRLSDTIMVFR